ncbi:hypothetical protein RA210_U100027 [Rubrivivax sp. A210]|uniref:hypothetical protein n=1 Tax=Rubrivivax sp. A210 TaxID=2772301 RepID=UPI0019187BBF|nr:hypothetical protein [Rubrivivax sp. A210]CAD5369104.1 hypothetical protein RA210_U100027 [Rubrivivax sp. A210]
MKQESSKRANKRMDDWGPPLLLAPILVLISGLSLAALVQMVAEPPEEPLQIQQPAAAQASARETLPAT